MKTFHDSLEIPATPDQVFAAIRDPERLARWWGPSGFTNTIHAFEFRQGGRWSLTMHGPDGGHWLNENLFTEIERPTRVVVRHDSEPKFTLTIALAASATGTAVSWAQAIDSDEVAERMEPIVVPANRQNLERLAVEVASGQAQV